MSVNGLQLTQVNAYPVKSIFANSRSWDGASCY